MLSLLMPPSNAKNLLSPQLYVRPCHDNNINEQKNANSLTIQMKNETTFSSLSLSPGRGEAERGKKTDSVLTKSIRYDHASTKCEAHEYVHEFFVWLQ